MATEIRNDITQFVLWYNNLPAYIKHVSHMLAVVKRATMCQGVSVECHVWINIRHDVSRDVRACHVWHYPIGIMV